MNKKRTSQGAAYRSLGDLTLEASAIQVVSERFDRSATSVVAKHFVERTLDSLSREERGRGVTRLNPFELRIQYAGYDGMVSLLDQALAERLANGAPYGQVLEQRRERLFKELLRYDDGATWDAVRLLLAPHLRLARGGARPVEPLRAVQELEQCRADLAELRRVVRVPEELCPVPEALPPPPERVVAEVGPLLQSEGMSVETSRTLIAHLASLRERFLPRQEDLSPGQLLAIAVDVRDRRLSLKTRLRAHLPVRLTLYTEDELARLERLGPRDQAAVDELLSRRVARLLTEAYCQGGLLSLGLVGLLTHQNGVRVGRLVDQFERRHGLILPTPGTIHDAGTKMTHKLWVVQLHLQDKRIKDIARQTFHTEEAVARYVDDFERVMIAIAHQLPEPLIPRVLKLSRHVVEQYVALVKTQIGDTDEVQALLEARAADQQVAS